MTATQQEFGLRLDPSLFEILRHRLWYLNDEGALTISRVSGSDRKSTRLNSSH